MKVILTADVNKLGKAGSLVDVSDGHARNYLIPKGLAVEATPGKTAEWQAEQSRIKAKDAKARQRALELQGVLQGKAVSVECRAGETGKLFGSITAAQIAEALAAQHGLNVDKRDVKLDDPVKTAGDYTFSVKLYPGIQADMTLTVTVA